MEEWNFRKEKEGEIENAEKLKQEKERWTLRWIDFFPLFSHFHPLPVESHLRMNVAPARKKKPMKKNFFFSAG